MNHCWKTYFSCCIWALALCLIGCDDLAFATGEMEAKRKYEAINPGTAREAVVRELGVPEFVLSWNAAQNRYDYRGTGGENGSFHPASESSANAPAELRFLPREMISPVVLVYSEGTVFGYVALDGEGRVARVKVAIS